MQRTKWALGFAMMVFGLLLTTQLRVQQQQSNPSRFRGDEAADLRATAEKLKASESERARLASELDKLQKQGNTGRVDTTPIEMLAGTIAMEGPGLIVTVKEAPEVSTRSRVRDEDLWMVINELLAAGAEGIAVNGQRLTSVSTIRNVGQRVIIHQTMTNSPFEVLAIGDPAVMEAALKLRLGVVDTLLKLGIRVSVSRSEKIPLPPFPGPPPFRFAKPVR